MQLGTLVSHCNRCFIELHWKLNPSYELHHGHGPHGAMHLLVCQHFTFQACTKIFFYAGLYNELLIINFISYCMAMLMELLMESLSGIFQKKYTKMKKQCDWYAVLKNTDEISTSSCCSQCSNFSDWFEVVLNLLHVYLDFISVCWDCIKICYWWTWQYIFRWQCSNGSYGGWTTGFKCFIIQGA